MRKNGSVRSVSNQTIVGGVLLGTALGAAAAFLFSQRGKGVRKNLAKMCCDLSDQAQDLAHQVVEKSGEWSHEVSDLFGSTNNRSHSQLNWIIGGIAGSVLGLSALVLLTHDSAKDVRQTLLDNVHCWTKKTSKFAGSLGESAHGVAENLEDKVHCWVNVAQKFIDSINGYAKTAVKKVDEISDGDSTLDKVVDWAAFGIRLYQSLKK